MDQTIGAHRVVDGLISALSCLKVPFRRQQPTFHSFNRLPPEIRNAIWDIALGDGDVVKFESKREGDSLNGTFRLRRTAIPLLAVNQESRSIVFGRYAPIFSAHYISSPLYVTWTNQNPPVRTFVMSHQLHQPRLQGVFAGAAVEVIPILDHPLGLPRFNPTKDLLFFVGGSNPYPIEAFGKIRRLARQWDARPDFLPHMRHFIPRVELEFFVVKFKNRLGWRKLARERCVRAQAEVESTVAMWKSYGRVKPDFRGPTVLTMDDFFETEEGKEMGKRYRATKEGRNYLTELIIPEM